MLPGSNVIPDCNVSLIVAKPSTFPVFLTVIVYVIISPSATLFLSAFFPMLNIGLYTFSVSVFVSLSPTTAVFFISMLSSSNLLIVTANLSSTFSPAGISTLFHVITFFPLTSSTV